MSSFVLLNDGNTTVLSDDVDNEGRGDYVAGQGGQVTDRIMILEQMSSVLIKSLAHPSMCVSE